MGRVNGNLAVSRAFGDPYYKMCVIAEPDVHTFVCEEGDIIVHICDGITETCFTIEEVRSLIRESLNKYKDIAVVSSKICLEALEKGSKDNLSCMIIILGDGKEYKNGYSPIDFFPGPFISTSGSYADAYEEMAEMANKSINEVLNERLTLINDKNSREKSELIKFLSGHPMMKLTDKIEENEKKNIERYLSLPPTDI